MSRELDFYLNLKYPMHLRWDKDHWSCHAVHFPSAIGRDEEADLAVKDALGAIRAIIVTRAAINFMKPIPVPEDQDTVNLFKHFGITDINSRYVLLAECTECVYKNQSVILDENSSISLSEVQNCGLCGAEFKPRVELMEIQEFQEKQWT